MPAITSEHLPTFEQLPETQEVDVVIVGAGVAGLYTAWKLLKDHHDLRIVIVERLNRTGGRLDTDLIRIKDSTGRDSIVRDEEGGMRFTDEDLMPELYHLIRELGLQDQIVPFPLTNPNNRYYVRGHSFASKDAVPALWSLLYNLAPAEQDKTPGTILSEVYHALLSANDEKPPTIPTPEYS